MKEPLQTGIKAIVAMIPNQPRTARADHRRYRTGKTTVALDAVINQGGDVICIYVAIGREALDRRAGSEDARNLRRDGVFDRGRGDHDSDPAPMRYAFTTRAARSVNISRAALGMLYVCTTIFRHAAAYREISLLLRRHYRDAEAFRETCSTQPLAGARGETVGR